MISSKQEISNTSTCIYFHYRLILIAEKSTVYEKFPTPLINRLEKHFVLTETVLYDWQKEVLARLIEWIKKFSTMIVGDSRFVYPYSNSKVVTTL